VRESGGKFRKEGKVTLLARGKRGASLGNGCHEGFVISEQGKRTALKEETEVADG
jgi:hypothetical protein